MSIPVFPEVWEAMDHDNHWSLAYTGIVDLYSVIIHIMMCHVFVYFIRNYGAYTKDEFTSLISKTTFKQYDIRQKGMGFYIYLAK